MIELLNSNELKLTLDPVETEEKVLSIAFDINAEMNLPYQNVQIEIKSCWIEPAIPTESPIIILSRRQWPDGAHDRQVRPYPARPATQLRMGPTSILGRSKAVETAIRHP
jgi:hypothetical protein